MTKPEKVRRPVVAGQFYPSSSGALNEQISSFIDKEAAKSDAIACILPHAGYVYSGAVAAKTLSQVNVKDNILLLGPNHTGYGAKYSIMTEGTWQTPLGDVKINSILADRVLGRCRGLKEDEAAHAYEHSLEVELPLLQYFNKDIRIVPIAFMLDDTATLKEIGSGIAHTIIEEKMRGSVMIVASSDMTHYETQEQAEEKDRQAIDAILELNEDKLIDRITRLDISMCGYAPVITMLSAAKLLGAKSAKLVKYQTSGDITGDKSSVVGYAGIIIY